MEYIVEKYIVIEIFEKIHRIRKFVEKSRYFIKEEGNQGTAEVFKTVLTKIQTNLKPPVESLVSGKLTDRERIVVNRILSNTLIVIKELHFKLKYIYSDWVRPETYTFTRGIVQEQLEQYDLDRLNIVLADEYTFKENNLIQKFNEVFDYSRLSLLSEEIAYPTLFLPKIEYNNPLNWAILAHELGHVDNRLIQGFVNSDLIPPNTTAENERILKKWAEEIYCDIFAVNLLGPAYFASFVSFAIVTTGLGGNFRNSRSHPSNMTRIRILHEYLKRNKSNIVLKSDDLGEFDMKDFFHKMIEDFDRIDRKIMKVDIPNVINIPNLTHFTDSIKDKTRSYGHLLTISEHDFNTVELLSNRLRMGRTIGSYPNYEKESLTSDLNDYTKNFDSIKTSFSERPSTIKQILTAGWVNKVTYHFPYMVKYVMKHIEADVSDFVDHYGVLIDKSDDRLLKSIESSELFSLIENQDYGIGGS